MKELTQKQTEITKGVAIMFMILLHLFCTKDYEDLFVPLVFIGKTPLVYYIGLFGDCCVAMFCFSSGYGLYIGYLKNQQDYSKKNAIRILKLYINYWVILLLFCVVLGLVMQKTGYPGSVPKFLVNFFALDSTYNGAWWFFLIYIILVAFSEPVFRIVKTQSAFFVLAVSFVIYCIGYYQRIKTPLLFDQPVLDITMQKLALVATSFLPFVAGAVFYEKKWISQTAVFFEKIKFRNSFIILLIAGLVVFHSFVQTLFIAVFTGIAFIVLFNRLRFSALVEKSLVFIGSHSTNLWLVHMFFYMVFFKPLVFAAKYPLFIFIWLLLLGIGCSFIIKWICDPLQKKADRFYGKKTITP